MIKGMMYPRTGGLSVSPGQEYGFNLDIEGKEQPIRLEIDPPCVLVSFNAHWNTPNEGRTYIHIVVLNMSKTEAVHAGIRLWTIKH